jgi:hypothetical protein
MALARFVLSREAMKGVFQSPAGQTDVRGRP